MNGSSAGDASSLTETFLVRLVYSRFDGDDEEDGICECNRGEAKRFRFCGGEYGGWGPDARLSSEREGNKDEDAHHEDDGCLDHWLSRRCRGLDWFDTGTHTGWRWGLSITFRATDTTVWTWSGGPTAPR